MLAGGMTDARGDVRDGGVLRELVDRRQIGVGEVGPRDLGQADDQHPCDGRSVCRVRGAGRSHLDPGEDREQRECEHCTLARGHAAGLVIRGRRATRAPATNTPERDCAADDQRDERSEATVRVDDRRRPPTRRRPRRSRRRSPGGARHPRRASPTRRCTSTPSTSAPTQKAAVCPMPNAATRAAPWVRDAPTTMTATPTTAQMTATIAGVRLSPSA